MKRKRVGLLFLIGCLIFCVGLSVSTAFAGTNGKITTGDDMISSGKLYNSLTANGSQLVAFNGVVTSSGDGHMIYDEETEGVDINIRITSGTSVFFVLRATDEKAIWDGGHGYFLMTNKIDTGTELQLLKGAWSGNAFTAIKTVRSTVNLFDGEKHNIRYVSSDTNGKVLLSFSVDGSELLTGEDTENVFPVEGSHYFMCSGSSLSMYKLYASNGDDVDVSDAEYITLTSKTMLAKASNWSLNGSLMESGVSISGTRDQSIAMFTRELKNVVYSFDIKFEDMRGNWVAVYLNANKADVPWNSGFRSVMLFFRETSVSIEYWEPSQVIASVDLAEKKISLKEKIHVEAGMYEVKLSTGTYTYIKLAVNGQELYHAPILTSNVSLGAGRFAFINYGTAKYTMYATENEVDSLPSASDGVRTDRLNESGLTNVVSVEDWAIIANSFDPYYSVADDLMKVENKGYLTYKNSVNFEKLTFSIRFEEADRPGQFAEFAFGKKRQNSIVDAKLADDYTNYGYMIRIAPSGAVTLVKTDIGANMFTLMNYDCANDFGISFDDCKWHTFTVYRSLKNERMEISLFVDDATYGYSVTDTDYYAPNYPMDGFLSFGNTTNGSSYYVKDIRFEGTETDVASTLKADAVNFVSYFEENGERFVYFCFDSASYTTKWVEIYASDKTCAETELLGRVYPKNTTFSLNDYEGEYILVKSVGFTEASSKIELLKLEKELPAYEDTASVRRIAIKNSEGGAYFVYEGTDEKFTPVGGNYMGLRGGDHSTFDAKTTFTEADYDPVKTEAMIRSLSKNNGNVLRVFLIGRTATNPGISGDSAYDIDDETYYYEGLYKPYMENVVHFLRTAQKYGVYVMLTLGDADVPSNDYYMELQGGSSLARNYMYFDQRGVNARKTYAKNVVSYLKTFAPDCMSGIFSVELQNEFAVYTDQWPFNQTSGTVTLANGKTYDMGDADSREAAFKEGVAYYINQVSSGIKSVDPNVLVNEGSFTRNIVGNNHVYGMQGIVSGDYRIPATFDIYLNTNIDFLDVHIYYANTSGNTVINSFADDLTYMNFWTDEVQELLKSKCIFMGEFGPSARVFHSGEEAENVWTETVRLATESGFEGFAVWTLESHNQTEHWNVLADDGKFDLFRQLVRIHMGVEDTNGITADDVTVNRGETVLSPIKNLLDGDKVTYTVNGVDYEELPSFEEAGVYTVEYRVERKYTEDKRGSFTVTVKGNEPSESGCGASITGSALLCCLMFAAAVLLKRNRKDVE